MENFILISESYKVEEIVKVEVLPNHNKIEYNKEGKGFEFITLKDNVMNETSNYILEKGSNDWYNVKCIELPQTIAKKHKAKGGRHFEENDLISYLTELSFRKLVKFDKSKVDYFESFMRRWLGKNVVDFFRDSKVDKLTDLETSLIAKADDEGGEMLIFDEPIDVWAELHSELDLQSILEDLEPEEQLIVERLLDGYNASEISRELGLYKMKVSRMIKTIVAKASIEKPQDRKTRYTNLKATVGKPKNQTYYNKLVDQGNLSNRIMYTTAKVWAKESKIEEAIINLMNIEDEEKRRTREIKINTWVESLEMDKKELEKLENKIK